LLPTGPIAQLYQIANFGNLNVRVYFLPEKFVFREPTSGENESKSKNQSSLQTTSLIRTTIQLKNGSKLAVVAKEQ
jgi:phage-related protein